MNSIATHRMYPYIYTMNGYIYMITCTGNNKSYIGQSVSCHRYTKHINQLKNNSHFNSLLQRSYNKYGESSLVFTILESGIPNSHELNIKETAYITKYKTHRTDQGFNIQYGGQFNKIDDDTKKKVSLFMGSRSKHWYRSRASKLERAVGMYNKHHTLIRDFDAAKDAAYYLNKSPSCINSACRRQTIRYGYIWKYLDEPFKTTKYMGRIGKPVFQYSINGKLISSFDSIKDASSTTGFTPTAIAGVANGRRKSHKGFIFSYEKKQPIYTPKSLTKKIDQFTLDGVYIRTFNSIKEAATSVGTYPSGISAVLSGKHNHYKGYKWGYHDQS